MDGASNWLRRNWQIITAITIIVFNVGYTIAKIQERPDRVEVTQMINASITEYDKELKDHYIEMTKVPGLKERLKAIDDKLNGLQIMFEKFEDRVYK